MGINAPLAHLTLAFAALILLLLLFITTVGVYFWYREHRELLKHSDQEPAARRVLGALGGLSLAAAVPVAWLLAAVADMHVLLVVSACVPLLLLGGVLTIASREASHEKVIRMLDIMIPTPRATVEQWQRQASVATAPVPEDRFHWPRPCLRTWFTALAGAVLLAGVAALVAVGRLEPEALIVALGIALAFHAGVHLIPGRISRRWRPVPATVTRSEVESVAMLHPGKPVARFRPRIEYKYGVGGNLYTATRISPFPDEYQARHPGELAGLLRRYPTRATPMVWHHPKRPQQAVLRPEAHPDRRRAWGLMLAGGLVLVALGLGLASEPRATLLDSLGEPLNKPPGELFRSSLAPDLPRLSARSMRTLGVPG